MFNMMERGNGGNMRQVHILNSAVNMMHTFVSELMRAENKYHNMSENLHPSDLL